jgi:hypothetical protein
MKKAIKYLIFASLLVFACVVDLAWEGTLKMTFVKDAVAIIGRPLTPISYAGVARRTTRRMVWGGAAAATTVAATDAAWASADAAQQQAAAAQQQAAAAQQQAAAAQAASGVPIGTVAQSLPAGCSPMTVSDKEYYDCHGSYYKAAFQGNNLVYVTVPKP